MIQAPLNQKMVLLVYPHSRYECYVWQSNDLGVKNDEDQLMSLILELHRSHYFFRD